MINDVDLGKSMTRLQYAKGVGSKLQPGLFERVRLHYPMSEFANFVLGTPTIYTQNGEIQWLAAYSTSKSATLRIQCTGMDTSFALEPTQNNIDRVLIRWKPDTWQQDQLNVSLTSAISGKNKYLKTFEIANECYAIDSLRNAVSDKLTRASHPLEKLHYSSLAAVVEDAYLRALVQLSANSQPMKEWVQYAKNIISTLKQLTDLAAEILKSRKALLVVFVASSDQSLQFYTLQLPKNYKPPTPYPLIVSLHGSGNPNALSFVGNYQEHGRNNVPSQNPHEAFILSPWSRGNQGGYSGNDIYDCMHDAQRRFTMDPDRRYLTGFSMGGWGTWLAARHHSIYYLDRHSSLCRQHTAK